MLFQKTMMALRPKGHFVARTKILTKHQGQQREQSQPRGGKPGAGAQPHALFSSRGGNLKKFEVYKMTSTWKMCFKRSPGAHFEGGSFQGCKKVAPTATRALFCRGHKWASEAFLKNVNGTYAGSRFLRKCCAHISHSKIFSLPKGLQQPTQELGTNRFSRAKNRFLLSACPNIGFCWAGEIRTSQGCQQ